MAEITSWEPFEPEWDGVLIDKISITNADGSVTDIPITTEQSVKLKIHTPYHDVTYVFDNVNKLIDIKSDPNHNYATSLEKMNATFKVIPVSDKRA